MTTVAEQPGGVEASSGDFETKVSPFDIFYSAMIALVVIIGFFALLLFFVWLSTYIIRGPRPTKVIPINDLMGRGDHAQGSARDIEEPGVEELPDVQEPQLADALEAMTDAISSQQASMEAHDGNAEQMGKGSGAGDSRAAGPGGEGNLDVIPPWERWEIKYSTKSVDDYAELYQNRGRFGLN